LSSISALRKAKRSTFFPMDEEMEAKKAMAQEVQVGVPAELWTTGG
jgi:hypothetical protein